MIPSLSHNHVPQSSKILGFLVNIITLFHFENLMFSTQHNVNIHVSRVNAEILEPHKKLSDSGLILERHELCIKSKVMD